MRTLAHRFRIVSRTLRGQIPLRSDQRRQGLAYAQISAGAVCSLRASQSAHFHVKDSQVTVWMPVSRSPPYILVRHATGLRVARGESDQERWEQADTLRETLGKDIDLGRASSPPALPDGAAISGAELCGESESASRPTHLKPDRRLPCSPRHIVYPGKASHVSRG